jgi:hypothetical protein
MTAEDHGGMNRLMRARVCLDRPWLPTFIVSAGIGLVTAYLLGTHFALRNWMVPELLIGFVLLGMVLERVSRHGGYVRHALKHVCNERGIVLIDDAAGAPEADKHRPAMS